ncbi:MAG: hypothetical protein A4E20_12185 [Nitrospira sp. SG-bin2]|uniref:hypothetical protein n=1 Tax=Nitrospira cf. moscoviensis SBR1015 TaxID=96242 RepID=UPI000A0D3D4E|nr:hypothetical protein [Nitrospira cf. moscoviensis SBR1015]OQW33980.1 MAG: hypothetical protein A4E20_12185 [Nitrospira sp. SG-bin2]
MSNITQETIELAKSAQSNPDDLIKSFVQPGTATTGLQAYNLEAPSKKLFPVLTPLRNMMPRDTGGFAIQANWKAITNINVANMRAGVAEGLRGGRINHEQSEYLAAFRGFGLENDVTFEAGYAAKGYEDVKALAVTSTLQALMIQEERTILGGNTSLAMGTTPTPTTATATTGGTIAAATYNVICVALSLQAYLDMVGANNGGIGQIFDPATSAVPGQITRTNAGGTTTIFGGGNAQQSAAASQATTGATSTLSATVTRVNGAVGYAWFVGTAGNERLQTVTSINSVTLTSLVGTGQLASAIPGGAADRSTSAVDFDGLLVQAFKPGSNATIIAQPTGVAGTGTPLTADGAGGIVEFEQLFVNMYNRYRLSPSVIMVSSQELINISKKVIQGSGAPLLQLLREIDGPTTIVAGTKIGSYMNKVTGDVVPVVVHPNMPAGTILFYTQNVPYPMSGVPSVARMLLRQDYYQLEWPLQQRKYDYGVYFDGVLQHYAPFSMGIITNIANG